MTENLRVRPGLARAATLGTLVSLILIGCGGAATPAATDTSPVSLDLAVTVQSPNYTPFYVADGLGLFSKAGLTINTVQVTGGQAVLAAIASGQVACAITGLDLAVLLASKKATGRVIVGLEAIPAYGLLVPAGSSVRSVRELKGAVIGVTGRGSPLEIAARYTLKEAGLDPDRDVTFVAIGSTPQNYIAAMANHQVGAVMSIEPTTAILVDQMRVARYLVNFAAGQGPAVFGLATPPTASYAFSIAVMSPSDSTIRPMASCGRSIRRLPRRIGAGEA